MTKPEEMQLDPANGTVESEAPPVGLERELFGKWSVLLRNTFGSLSVLVVCCTALFNSWTINVSVTKHNVWPSEMSMFIMMVGPIVCAWTWVNANKTITTIMQAGGLSDTLRSRLSRAIAPSDPVGMQERPETPPPGPPRRVE